MARTELKGDGLDKRKIVEQYAQAFQTRDIEMSGTLMHPEIVARYPQSGETIRGRDNYLATLAAYPLGLPNTDVSSVKGGDKAAVVPSSLPFARPTVTVFGGDQYVIEGVATYPDGAFFHVVLVLRLRDGKVFEETSYFAAPFDPPEWRQDFVELDEPRED